MTKFTRFVYCSHVIACIKTHIKGPSLETSKFFWYFSGICFPINPTFSYYCQQLHWHKPFKIITTSTNNNLSLRPCAQSHTTSCHVMRLSASCYNLWTKLVETTFPSIPNKYPLYNKFHVKFWRLNYYTFHIWSIEQHIYYIPQNMKIVAVIILFTHFLNLIG